MEPRGFDEWWENSNCFARLKKNNASVSVIKAFRELALYFWEHKRFKKESN
jgi:hypothetical protein